MARVQEKYQRKLMTAMKGRRERERFIDQLKKALSKHGGGMGTAWAREDHAQMCEGLMSILTEGLQGRSNELRTIYVETVVSGLMAQGATPQALKALLRAWSEGVQKELETEMENLSDKREGMQWMREFFDGLVLDVERTAHGGVQ